MAWKGFTRRGSITKFLFAIPSIRRGQQLPSQTLSKLGTVLTPMREWNTGSGKRPETRQAIYLFRRTKDLVRVPAAQLSGMLRSISI